MTVPLRVLHVEDNEDDTQLILRELRRGGYDVACLRVETAAAMHAALERARWDLVIADYTLPRFDALTALKLLRELDDNLPFIIVSGSIGEETAVAAVKAGVNDYIMKDKLARLIPAVERELREAQVRRAHKQAEQQIQAYQAELEKKVRLLEAQQAVIRELSTPVIQVWEGVLMLPIIGTVDSSRVQQIMEHLLARIVETQSEIVILDITGVPVVDTAVANHLIKTVQAAQMLGARSIITGLSPRIAQTIVELGIDLGEMTTCATARSGLERALEMRGVR